MSARSDVASLAIVAGVHLVIGGVHQYAHAVAEVKNSSLQVLVIVLVVTIAPWAAIGVAWTRNLTISAVVFSGAMLASPVFGLVFHFAVESPDLYLNVVPEHRTLFLHSAVGLPRPPLRTGFHAGGEGPTALTCRHGFGART